MRDRRIGFCYQEVPAVEAIHHRFRGKRRTTALAVYQAITYVANERRCREDFTASRAEVAELAGVARTTLDTYAAEFEALGLVEVDRRRTGPMTNLPNTWTLLSGRTPSSVAELGGSSANRTVQIQQEEKKQQEGDHQGEWIEWLAHYRSVTGRSTVKGSKPARREFNARLEDYSLADLKLATVGCHGDEYCRRNGYDVPETILRASKVTRYIELGRQTQTGEDDGF